MQTYPVIGCIVAAVAWCSFMGAKFAITHPDVQYVPVPLCLYAVVRVLALCVRV